MRLLRSLLEFLNSVVESLAASVAQRSFFPFTTGLVFVVYAFFWPESYGRWLGTIVLAFRVAAGI